MSWINEENPILHTGNTRIRRKIKVKKDVGLPGLKFNEVYVLDDVKLAFPFINFNNKEFFEEVFDTNKFNIGDRVKYVGGENRWVGSPSNKFTWKITKVIPNVWGRGINFEYEVYNEAGEIATIAEKHLEKAETLWIVSFSSSKVCQTPAVQELDPCVFDRKIKGRWKELMVFTSKEEATRAAVRFAHILTRKDW